MVLIQFFVIDSDRESIQVVNQTTNLWIKFIQTDSEKTFRTFKGSTFKELNW